MKVLNRWNYVIIICVTYLIFDSAFKYELLKANTKLAVLM